MAKNNVKQLNYTFEEINLALQAALDTKGIELQYSDDNNTIQLVCDGEDVEKRVLSSIQNPVSENGGITLQYQDDGKLQVYYQNGSSNPNDWTSVGDPVVIISADPNANSYRFNFESLTDLYSIQIKSKIDDSVNYNDWAIKYRIQEIDKSGVIQPTNIAVDWTISKNSNSRTFSETLSFNPDSSEYSFDWLKRIISDTSFYQTGLYTIKGRFVGTDGNTTNRSWQVNITDLKLSVVLDETMQYSKNNLPKANLTIEGNLKKSIKATLIDYSKPLPNQEDGYEQTVIYQKEFAASSDDILDNFTIDDLKHGVYGILFETTGVINDVSINASNVYKEFIFIEADNPTPLIRWGFDESKELTQYEYETFTYGIYNPTDTISQLGIELYSENNNKTQVLSVVPDNRNYSWVYYAAEGSNNLKQLFSISLINDKTIANIKRILTKELANASLIQSVGGCAFDFNPVGRSNNDIDRTEYIYNGQNYLQVSENFDWINGGWKYDSQNRPYFCVKAGHWAELDYKLFGSDVRSTGKNFKILFKTANCQKIDAQAIECYNDKVGLKVLAQNATLNYRGQEGSLIDVPYIEEEIIPLEFNIQKDLQYSKPLKPSIAAATIRPLVTVFLDADPSQTSTFAASDESLMYNWQQEVSQPIHIGSSDCDVLIYRIKVYEQELTNKQILQNYYADSFTGTEALLKHEENNILNTDGTINIAILKEKYPDLRILEIECDNIWPRGKSSSDYQACTITHSMGNNSLKDNWSVRGRVRLQGTSSLEYISSAGNFDINFRDNILYKHTDGLYYTRQELIDNNFYTDAQLNEVYVHEDIYAMTDNSIPVDYFNIKVNVASSENANNSQLADWFNMHNPYIRSAKQNGVRDTMEFHPCVVFIKEKSTDPKEFPSSENFNFYACGDFGNSKKNDAVFGMNAEDPYECILEISNNDNPICLFKTAIFENYQTNAEKDDETQLLSPVTNDVWDGDAVEFRYINEGHEDLMKERVRRLWKWVYSTDTSQPGVKEYFALAAADNWRVDTETAKTIFTIDTPIPYDENTIIQTIAPSFLLAYEAFNDEGKLEWQTLSKYDLYQYRDIVGINQVTINITKSSLGSMFTITVPNFSVQFSDLEHSKLGFFITFYNKYVLDDNFSYISDQDNQLVLDSADYRQNKFQSEYMHYFEKNSLLFHYLFTERFTMIDNRAKNTFIHTNSVDGVYKTETGENSEPGSVWNYSFNYDDDTALGCNNKGFLTMDYGVEDIDNIDGYPVQTHGGTPAFNAASSVLWNNVRNLKTELVDAYNANISAWSAESLNQKFETYQNYKCPQLEMLDMERKYFRPYVSGYYGDNSTVITTYLPMLQGRKKYQRKRFQSYQSIYIESKYKQPNVAPTSNIFTFRTTIQGGSIQPEIKPYMKCYPSIKYDQVSAYTDRVWPGESFKPAAYSNPNDKNFTIYPASYISALNGLDNAGLETATLSSGTKLLEVNLSNNPNLPESANDNIQISEGNTLLQIVNISNTKAQSFENLNKLSNLRSFNAQDTNITTAIFATGGLIEEALLGEKISTLTFNSNTNLRTLDIQSLNNLETLRIITPSNQINWSEIFTPQTCPKLKNITITNINYTTNNCWSFDNNNWLESIYQLKQTYSNIVLTGVIYIDQLRKSDYDKYLVAWPGLAINYNTDIGFMIEHKITFKNYDDSILLEYYVDDETTTLKNPNKQLGDKLNRPADPHYTYTFLAWDPSDFNSEGDYIGQIIKEDREYIATYTSEVRKYKVVFISNNKNQDVEEYEVEYGQECVRPEFDLNSYYDTSKRTAYVFNYWDGISSYITKDTTITAHWDSANASTAKLSLAKLLYIKNNDGLINYFEPGDRIKVQMGINRNFTNIECINGVNEPMKFDGSTCIDVLDSNGNPVTLTDVDKDWTILIEYKPLNNNGSLFGWSDFSGKGVSIGLHNSIIASSDNMTFGTNASSYTRTGSAMSTPNYQRDVVILTHKAGSGYVAAYQCAPWAQEPVVATLDSFTIPKTPTKLTLGGRKKIITNEGGTQVETAFDFGTGIIYDCKIWPNITFTRKDCLELVQWTSEEISFDVVGEQSKLVTDQSFQCNLELMTSGTLHFPRTADGVSQSGGVMSSGQTWKDMEIYEWMHTRLYSSLPIGLQNLMFKCDIDSNIKGGGIQSIPSYCWLPSLSNIIDTTLPEYMGEDNRFSIMTNKYSTFRWTNAWAHEYFSGNENVINESKPLPPELKEGDMYLSFNDKTAKNFQNIQIYNDLEWHNQFYYGTSGYGPCYWLRTPHSSQSYLGFLQRGGEAIDYDSGNPARAVVFCIAI